MEEVQRTDRYSQFKKLDGNRKLDSKHLEHLEKSFQEQRISNPIIVNENMEVIDGQYRLEICRRNGWEVEYRIIPSLGLEHARLLNQCQKPWTRKDLLTSLDSRGSKSAHRLLSLTNRFNVSGELVFKAAGKDADSLSLLTDKTPESAWFDDTAFSQKQHDIAKARLGYASQQARKLADYRKINRNYVMQSFVIIQKASGLDRERLTQVIARNGYEIPARSSSIRPICEAVCRIYNDGLEENYMDIISDSKRGFKITCLSPENRWPRSTAKT